jgi:hypothetical protein
LARYVQSDELVEGYDGTIIDKVVVPNNKRTFFSTQELLVKALHIDIGKVDRAGSMQRSVGNAMKMMGFVAHKWTEGRARPRGYLRVQDEPPKAVASLPPPKPNEVPAWD